MKTLQDEKGERKIVFLSQKDKDVLIYMYSDAWITPEIKRFKNSLLERVQAESMNKDSDSWIWEEDYGVKGNMLGQSDKRSSLEKRPDQSGLLSTCVALGRTWTNHDVVKIRKNRFEIRVDYWGTRPTWRGRFAQYWQPATRKHRFPGKTKFWGFGIPVNRWLRRLSRALSRPLLAEPPVFFITFLMKWGNNSTSFLIKL